MKIIRTARLTILETFLVGGQCSTIGDYSEGSHIFTEYYEELKQNGKFCLTLIKEAIINAIDNYNDDNWKFEYYGDHYKFKIPSEKNLNVLAKRIQKILIIFEQNDKEDDK